MILELLFVAQAAVASDTTVAYPDLPKDVVSATVYVWNDQAPVKTSAVPHMEEPLTLVRRPGARVVVAFVRQDGTYRLDGPFVWPDRNLTRVPDPVWRHTVSGTAPAGPDLRAPLTWISAEHDAVWPRCVWGSSNRWECWGIPRAEAGVLVESDGAHLQWRTVQPVRSGDWHPAEWGRLMVVSDSVGLAPAKLQVQVQQAVAPPGYRQASVRVQTAAAADVTVAQLSAGAVWLGGSSAPDHAWVLIRAPGCAPQIVQLADVAEGSFTVPELIELDPVRHVQGTVLAGTQAASGSTVTAFRLIDPPSQPDDWSNARRVFAEETSTDDHGSFALDELGIDQYEILAWDPQRGRASLLLNPGQQDVTLHLGQTGVARGRVLVEGKPVAGVTVFSVPDPNVFASAADPVDVKGGDGRTDSDGRFLVAVAPSGGGELRIGGGGYSTKRVPLPRMPVPLVDVGDVDLGSPLAVQIVLDRDPGCNLLATGPVGRLGLQVVTGVRTGPGVFRVVIPEEGQWQFGLECGGTIGPLVPTLVSIGLDLNGKEIRLVVPRQ